MAAPGGQRLRALVTAGHKIPRHVQLTTQGTQCSSNASLWGESPVQWVKHPQAGKMELKKVKRNPGELDEATRWSAGWTDAPWVKGSVLQDGP